MKTNIVVWDKPRGGLVTFMRHLIRVLGDVSLLRISKQRRMFDYYGMEFRGIPVEEVPDLPTIIMDQPLRGSNTIEKAEKLMTRIQCVLVLHGGNSRNEKVFIDIAEMAREVVVMRASNLEICNYARVMSRPYSRTGIHSTHRPLWAISHTRIGFDKNQNIMLDANRLLPEEKRIDFFCSPEYVNRQCSWVLSQKYKEWGMGMSIPFIDPVEVCSSAVYDVDCTVLPNDGGGTQYTMLEAADGGAVPVLLASWNRSDGIIQPDVNYVAIEDGTHLAEILQRPRDAYGHIVGNNYDLLNDMDNGDWLELVHSYRDV